MRKLSIKEPTILAIYFNTRGFGYGVFEGITEPIDWGMKTKLKGPSSSAVEQVRLLLHIHQPSVVVLQNCSDQSMRCSRRAIVLIAKVKKLANSKKVKVRQFSRTEIRKTFAPYGARNKDEIARAIAERLPEFAPRVPPYRKVWMSEDYRMGLFDALSLVVTYYANEI